MSRPEETERPERPVTPPSAEKPEASPEADEKTQGLKYVFKIAPADPKNAFDFEDVADK